VTATLDQATMDAVQSAVRDALNASDVVKSNELNELRHFVDRRIKELGVEIGAIMQYIDISTGETSRRFQELRKSLATIVDRTPGSESVKGGIELEAVVIVTEDATDRILDAAESITSQLPALAAVDPQAEAKILASLNSIFEACTFQDITGQRIRRVIEHLCNLEENLGLVASHFEPPTSDGDDDAKTAPQAERKTKPAERHVDVTQSDVDRLMAGD
jgi:chemotaxis protein CheZ